jgi:hypothetical protein
MRPQRQDVAVAAAFLITGSLNSLLRHPDAVEISLRREGELIGRWQSLVSAGSGYATQAILRKTNLSGSSKVCPPADPLDRKLGRYTVTCRFSQRLTGKEPQCDELLKNFTSVRSEKGDV